MVLYCGGVYGKDDIASDRTVAVDEEVVRRLEEECGVFVDTTGVRSIDYVRISKDVIKPGFAYSYDCVRCIRCVMTLCQR